MTKILGKEVGMAFDGSRVIFNHAPATIARIDRTKSGNAKYVGERPGRGAGPITAAGRKASLEATRRLCAPTQEEKAAAYAVVPADMPWPAPGPIVRKPYVDPMEILVREEKERFARQGYTWQDYPVFAYVDADGNRRGARPATSPAPAPVVPAPAPRAVLSAARAQVRRPAPQPAAPLTQTQEEIVAQLRRKLGL